MMPMSGRRHIRSCVLAITALTAAGLACGLRPARAQDEPAARRPNVVVILADDLGYADLSCYGGRDVSTPRMDSLATDGMRFTDAHSPSSVCSPSRYNLLTGRHSWRTYANMSCFWLACNPMPIEPDRLTLAKLFKQHGYRTTCIGKWHLSFGDEQHPITDYTVPFKPGPLETGFDSFFGFPHVFQTPHLYIRDHDVIDARSGRPLRDIFRERGQTPPPSGITYRRDPNALGSGRGWCDRAYDGRYAEFAYQHEDVAVRMTQEAVDFIDKASPDEPFFLYFPHRNVHGPYKPHPRFKSTPREYLNFLLELDWSVGEVLDALERKGVADDTVVILSSDNGGVESRSNIPLRGRKTQSWEGGHRVPFIVKWPGRVRPGSVSGQLVASTDLIATFADFFGDTLPDHAAEDSFSFLPALVDAPSGARPREFLVHDGWNERTWGMRRGKWVLLLPNADPEVTREYRFRHEGLLESGERIERPMLFDLEVDLAQTHDVAAEHPEIVAELRGLLESIRKSSSRVVAAAAAPRRDP